MGAEKGNDRRGSLGFEKKLWEAADLLRSNMAPAECKHVVLGLLFLKHISDAFEERRGGASVEGAEIESDYFVEDETEREQELSTLLEERDEYSLAQVFCVPAEVRCGSTKEGITSSSDGRSRSIELL